MCAHGWKYLVFDKQGWLYVPFGPPCNVCLPPTSLSQIRRVESGDTVWRRLVALGVRNSVGGDVDPRTGDYWFTENARDWLGDDKPSDKLNHIAKMGEHFGYPYCHEGDIPDPKFAMGHKCSEFVDRRAQARRARGAARHEVLHRQHVPRRLSRTT